MTGWPGVGSGVVMMWGGVPVVSVMMMVRGVISVAMGYMKSIPGCSRWWLLVLCPARSALISLLSRAVRAAAIVLSNTAIRWSSRWYASESAGRFVRGYCWR